MSRGPNYKSRRIILLCEGDTEELAVRFFISRQWQADKLASVGLHAVNLHGKLQAVSPKARLYLDEENVLAVFTLIDLYGMDRVAHKVGDSVQSKVERIQAWLQSLLNHSRSRDFRPHICVHETEAWLLAEGRALAKRLGDSGIAPDPQAESKDFQTPPSKRINEICLHRRSGDRYHKIVDGRPLFSDLQFEPVYKTCGYFRSFYDDLRAVGGCSPK